VSSDLVGSSKDIQKRWKSYKVLNCKSQIKLYNSLVKYGVDNHFFNVQIECSIDELFEWEHHYSNYYDSINKGLNCRIPSFGDVKGLVSKDTIQKMIDNHPKNNKEWLTKTKERLLLQSKDPIFKAKVLEGRKKWMETVNLSEIIKDRIKNTSLEKKYQAICKRKETLIIKNNGSYHSQEFKDNLSKRNKGVTHTEEHKKKLKQNWESRRPSITDITTGIEYKNIDELCKTFNISKWTLGPKLTGRRPNNTNFRYKQNIDTPTETRKKPKNNYGSS
jgi:hypothetical protein